MSRSYDNYDSFDPNEFPAPPQPRTSVTNVILCILNVIAVLAVGFCMMLDLSKRQAWSYAVFLRDLSVMGLPLEEEATGFNSARETIPKATLTPEQLKAAYDKPERRGESIGQDKFVVNEFPIAARIVPSNIDDKTLERIFGTMKPVRTLNEEVIRVRESVFGDVEQVAKETIAQIKIGDDKRKKLREFMLPLARNATEYQTLEAEINKNRDDAGLDALLAETIQRRMLLDILNPIEVSVLLEKDNLAGDGLQKLKDRLTFRLNNALDKDAAGSIVKDNNWTDRPRDIKEKRANIALLLFAVAHVVKPDGKLLYEDGPERAQIVVGLFEFTKATRTFNAALDRLKDSKDEMVRRHREGVPIVKMVDDNLKIVGRTPSFKDEHPELINKIQLVLADIEQEKRKIADMEAQNMAAQKTHETRVQDRQNLTIEIIAARKKSAELMDKLHLLQGEYFDAVRELTDAEWENFRKERELRRLEESLIRNRGLLKKKDGGK